jgi:putative sigma-54 modulation protein
MRQTIDLVLRAATEHTAAALRDHVARRLSFALRRFEHHVGRVTVRLIDLNGPRRGVDSRCSITLELVGGGRRIVAEATTAVPFGSVTRAASRLKAALRRELKRAASHT